MKNKEIELSESLLTACKAAGIENPRYVAQDGNGEVWHYNARPEKVYEVYFIDDVDYECIDHPPYADDWRDSLMEWVEPKIDDISSRNQPLFDFLYQEYGILPLESDMQEIINIVKDMIKENS